MLCDAIDIISLRVVIYSFTPGLKLLPIGDNIIDRKNQQLNQNAKINSNLHGIIYYRDSTVVCYLKSQPLNLRHCHHHMTNIIHIVCKFNSNINFLLSTLSPVGWAWTFIRKPYAAQPTNRAIFMFTMITMRY